MSRIAKVAISLPEDMLRDVEKQRKSSGESRSRFFQRAAERLLKHEQEALAVKDYIRGYREMPETAEDIEAADRTGITALAQEPW